MCISGNAQFNETDGRINTSAYIITGHDVTARVKVSIFQALVRGNARHVYNGAVFWVDAAYRRDYQGQVAITVGGRSAMVGLSPDKSRLILQRFDIPLTINSTSIEYEGTFVATFNLSTPINTDRSRACLLIKAEGNNYRVSLILMLHFHLPLPEPTCPVPHT